MARRKTTIDIISELFCKAVKEIFEASTGTTIKYAPTIQRVPSISLKPDLGCFVQFAGDYSGLIIMNFAGDTASELYHRAMTFMGMPEEIEKEYTSEEVVNFIGEMVNQIIGNARRKIEARYGLTASNSQPKAITISSEINMSIASTLVDRPRCRRLSFRTEQGHRFYIEMSMEQTEFIRIKKIEQQKVDIDALLEQAQQQGDTKPGQEDTATASTGGGISQDDIDSLFD
jgi:CheY-specific phosphatase CheX